MENILRIIYDKTINNKILSLKDIEKILELLVIQKCLNKYILNINVQQIRSNNLASYSINDKKIIIYSNIIKKMVKDIKFNLNCNDQVTKNMYINLSILQIILHEIEHANQEKIINYNTLESFILRISKLVKQNNQVYEFNPKERPWKNKWLKYAEKLNLTSEEVEFLTALYDYKQNSQVNGLEENRLLSKRR